MAPKRSVVNGKEHGRLRVIIVGGSIAGLTLAHSLHHSNIDFVVLEAGKEIAAQVGASIAIFPNGARILDQLGLYDDISAVSAPLISVSYRKEGGKQFMKGTLSLLMTARFGYPAVFMQRRDLLDILFRHIHDKAKIHTSKRVCQIEHRNTEVVVQCEDGSSYTGDIVVGADGIHSTVRTFMHEHIEKKSPGKADKDKKSISAEYNCIFGLGNSIKGDPDLVPGHMHRTYSKGRSTLLFIGHDQSLYWFMFSKLDKKYNGKDIPRYTKAQMEEAVEPFLNLPLTESIEYDKVWDGRTFANMTCIEEASNENWTSDRFVCIGDSIHKVTPNAGTGGNTAIETAAALANSLAKFDSTGKPSLEEIRSRMLDFYEKRHLRVDLNSPTANLLTRIETLATMKHQLLAFYIIPNLGDSLINRICTSLVGAELLDSLPAPPRSNKATMPWNPNGGVGKEENRYLRALYALPLLFIAYACHRNMGATINALVIPKTTPGTLALSPDLVIPLWNKFFGFQGLNNFLSKFVAFFSPSIGNFDPVGRLQAIAFLGDLIPIQVIWIVEGIRRGNFGTAGHLLPTILGVLYQIRGIGSVAPIYYFLHYVQCPLENYAAADNRMTQMGPVKTIIPLIIITFVLPSFVMFLAPRLETRQWVNGAFWQLFPVIASMLQRILGWFVTDTTKLDQVSNPEADMPYLRAAYGFAAAAAACAYLYVRLTSPVSFMEIFFSGLANPAAALPLIEGAAKALRYDQIAAFSAGALWILLSFGDLKKTGKIDAGWGHILGVFAGTTIAGGPGAAMAVMWAWREESMARRGTNVARKK